MNTDDAYELKHANCGLQSTCKSYHKFIVILRCEHPQQ